MRLLILDDHAGARRLIREIFTGVAHEIEECATAGEALERCGSFQPDIVTVDYRLTDMDGVTALRHMRALSPGTRYLLVTQCDQREVREQARKAGAHGVFLKDLLGELSAYARAARVLQEPGA